MSRNGVSLNAQKGNKGLIVGQNRQSTRQLQRAGSMSHDAVQLEEWFTTSTIKARAKDCRSMVLGNLVLCYSKWHP